MTDPQHEETFADTERKLREIITTLRAQLAEARAELDYANKRIEHAFERIDRQAATIDELTSRADRAEAALAAQKELLEAAQQDAKEAEDLANELLNQNDSLKHSISVLEARVGTLMAERHHFTNAVADAARKRGEAEGKLLASQEAGILQGWMERCEKAEAALADAREKALREAAKACDWGDIYGDNAVRAIIALIEKPNAR